MAISVACFFVLLMTDNHVMQTTWSECARMYIVYMFFLLMLVAINGESSLHLVSEAIHEAESYFTFII